MTVAKKKKTEAEAKPVVIVVNGDEFDSSKGSMSMGDMTDLEDMGLDFKALEHLDDMPVTKVAKIAMVCLKAASGGTVDTNMEYVKKIPASQFKDLTKFVLDFYPRNFQGSAEDKETS